ncbi:MAG: extracellular solute-binding protein [Clostridia bacterium]|nr:extracellular solute-binding protein [Clostridia bacterium]
MKKTAIKLIAIFSVLAILLTGIGTAAVSAAETEEPVLTIGAESSTTTNTSPTAYTSYISKQNGALAKGDVELKTNLHITKKPVKVKVEVKEDGLYNIGFSYLATDDANTNLTFSLKVDGKIFFDEAEKLTLFRIYKNEGDVRVDGLGNQFAPKQVPTDKFYFSTLNDITNWTNDPYLFYLTKGTHELEITALYGEFKVEKIVLGGEKDVKDYQKPTSNFYKGEPVIIEAESATDKTSYWLAGKSDNSTIDITPNDSYNTLVNYIGGGNWATNGSTLTWETPELKAGYYNIAFMYRQSAIIGAKVYRTLKIDGEVPFKEAENVGFAYTYNWKETTFGKDEKNPYYVYLSEGKHTISLTVVPGEIAGVRDSLKAAINEIGSLYIDITMITGETVDTYRDYDLFTQIPDMEERLNKIRDTLLDCSAELKEITGEKSGSYISIIDNMRQAVELMINNRYTAHRYKSTYYSRYTSLASVLYEMNSMPLDIDKISLYAAEDKPFEMPNFIESTIYSIERFLVSFVNDYNNISVAGEGSESVTIWVNWGRDQAQVLNSLIQTSFTPNSKISVNVQLVNASIVQAILSGKGPDCLLQHSRSEPVNLAMRGVLYDMTKFDDLDDVLKDFGVDAALPYYYKGGLYGLPDTQSFYLMYYRKDLLEEMDIEVPETWEDFEEAVRLLATNNLTAWLPNNTATSVGQANAGIGSINIFPTLMLQRGVSIYKEDGRSTNLSSAESSAVFNDWTDFYTKLRMPRTLDFYNRFRTGSCPLGISTHTMYTTLKAAAPEIDGLWGVALVPGTVQEDGTVNHVTSGGGTACSIMQNSKNPKAAWEFIKWWISSETQLAYSNEIETILGPTGRVSVSNLKAFESLEWDMEMRDTIVKAMNQIREVPEYPGSYYVSRSVYQSFWNVVENNKNSKETLLEFSEEANVEIERKWRQYENR